MAEGETMNDKLSEVYDTTQHQRALLLKLFTHPFDSRKYMSSVTESMMESPERRWLLRTAQRVFKETSSFMTEAVLVTELDNAKVLTEEVEDPRTRRKTQRVSSTMSHTTIRTEWHLVLSASQEETTEWLIETIKKQMKAKELVSAAARCLETLQRGDVHGAIQELGSDVIKMRGGLSKSRPVREFTDIGWRLDLIKNKKEHPEQYAGIKCGIPTLDRETGGFFRGELTLISLHTGVGKTVSGNTKLHVKINKCTTDFDEMSIRDLCLFVKSDLVPAFDTLDGDHFFIVPDHLEISVMTPNGEKRARAFKVRDPESTWYLKTKTGKSIEVADKHLFKCYCPNREKAYWSYACDLRSNDYIFTMHGVELLVEVTHFSDKIQEFYDIQVDGEELYTDGFHSHNSTLIRNIIGGMLASGANVLLVINEEVEEQACGHFDSMISRVHYNDFKRGVISDENIERWKEKIAQFKQTNGRLFIQEIAQFTTVAEIEKTLVELQQVGVRIDAVALDYLDHLKPIERAWGEIDAENKAIAEFKGVGIAFRCATITATQADTKSFENQEDAEPSAYNVRGSKQKPGASNVVLFGRRAHFEEGGTETDLEITCVKNRDGAVGFRFWARVHNATGSLTEIPRPRSSSQRDEDDARIRKSKKEIPQPPKRPVRQPVTKTPVTQGDISAINSLTDDADNLGDGHGTRVPEQPS